MEQKLSEQLYEAVINGEKSEQERIQLLINQGKSTDPKPVENKVPDSTWFRTKIFNTDNINPLDIKSELDRKYGDAWIGWLPETLDRTIFLDYTTILNQVVREKLLAMKSCINSNIAWLDFDIFSKTVLALNGVIPSFKYKEDPTVAQIIKALRVMVTLREGELFDDDVSKYIATVCKKEGLVMELPQLSFIKPFMIQLTLEENLKYRPVIEERFRQVIRDRNIDTLKDDDLVDIQVRRLLVKSAASYTGY